MEYKRINDTIIARIDRGQEITQQVKAIALKENIKLASVEGLGAVSSFTVGVFKMAEKKFFPNTFEGDFEITSLTGTINTMNGEYYGHLHMSAADAQGHVYGGHLNMGVVSATCEIVIRIIDGVVDREREDLTGINLLSFK